MGFRKMSDSSVEAGRDGLLLQDEEKGTGF